MSRPLSLTAVSVTALVAMFQPGINGAHLATGAAAVWALWAYRERNTS